MYKYRKNKRMKKKLLLFIAVFTFGINAPVVAQFGPNPPPPVIEEGPEPPPPDGGEGPDPPPSAPIDSYISLLIIAGAAVGYMKLNNKEKSINFK
jgi:hypothetical protein